jgi:hypothetical protein
MLTIIKPLQKPFHSSSYTTFIAFPFTLIDGIAHNTAIKINKIKDPIIYIYNYNKTN